MWRMHRAVPVVLIVVLGGLTACGGEDQSPNAGEESGQAQGSGDETTDLSDETADISASCAADITEVSDATVAPGESIVVSAEHMWEECLRPNEQWPSQRPHRDPETDQPVVWRQGSVESVLATGDANSDGVFEMSVTIPDDAQPGTADITIGIAQSATVTVEDQSPDTGEKSGQAQGSGDETASACCAAPTTEVSDATVAPGESIVVSSAQQGLAECLAWEPRDAGDETPGSLPSERPDVAPETDEPVVWRQDSVETVLATADPNSDGVFELSVTIPDDAQPGAAEITIGFAGSATVTVEPQN